MKELFELNRQILAELPPGLSEDDLPLIDREDGPQLWPGASAHLQQMADVAFAELNRFLPADFYYTVLLGEDVPSIAFDFENDGEMGTCPAQVSPEHLTIVEYLGGMNWAELREAGAKNLMDRFAEDLAALPKIVSTKKLQQLYREDMKAWVKEKRRDQTKAFVLMGADDDEFVEQEFESREAFERDIYDLLMVTDQVIAIVVDGKPLPVKRIEQMKMAAYDKLLEDTPELDESTDDENDLNPSSEGDTGKSS